MTSHIRGGLEFTQLTGTRPAVFDPTIDGRSMALEIRYNLR